MGLICGARLGTGIGVECLSCARCAHYKFDGSCSMLQGKRPQRIDLHQPLWVFLSASQSLLRAASMGKGVRADGAGGDFMALPGAVPKQDCPPLPP
jgi:hypothetical protein